jgi:hypothetical protein
LTIAYKKSTRLLFNQSQFIYKKMTLLKKTLSKNKKISWLIKSFKILNSPKEKKISIKFLKENKMYKIISLKESIKIHSIQLPLSKTPL